MELFECIKTRRSTRNYLDKKIETKLIEQVIEAGRFSPSGGNSQSNHFIVIQNKQIINDLVQMVESAFSKMTYDDTTYKSLKSSIIQSQKGGYRFCFNAPVLIIVANKKDYGNNQADVSIAIENMILAANALDLGSCYVNQLKWLNEDQEIKEYLFQLGMKEDERVYGSLVLGYVNELNRTPLKRTGNEVTWHL